MGYDAVIVGASIAGCTAAVILGRAGLRVALVEKRRSVETYKTLCGHFILGGAEPTLQRIGFWKQMANRGATILRTSAWSEAGWTIAPDDSTPSCISLPRWDLDPMLRKIAASTAGVDLLLGHTVTALTERGGAITGVRVTTAQGTDVVLMGRVVIGADGVHSTVARLADVPARTSPNGRFMYWAYYEGVALPSRDLSKIWLLDPDVVVAFPTTGGLTQLGSFPSKARLSEFKESPGAAIERSVRAVADAPELSGANRISKVIGTPNYPCVRRDPVPRPGLALVGDAALASDPVTAVGCGWAFRSAESLATALTPCLQEGSDIAPGLASYRREHRFFEQHDFLIRREAKNPRKANYVQRIVRTAAVYDRAVADRMYLFGIQAAPITAIVDPALLLRSQWVAARGRRAKSTPLSNVGSGCEADFERKQH